MNIYFFKVNHGFALIWSLDIFHITTSKWQPNSGKAVAISGYSVSTTTSTAWLILTIFVLGFLATLFIIKHLNCQSRNVIFEN